MILDVEIDPGTKAVKVDGGRIELSGATGNYMLIQQAQGAKAPKPAPGKMAGVVLFNQGGATVTATLFTGALVGDLTNGTLTATDVRFEAYNQTHVLSFTMVNGNGGATSHAAATPPAPKPAAQTATQTTSQPGQMSSVQLAKNIALYNAAKNNAPANPVNSGAANPANNTGDSTPTKVLLDSSNTSGVTQTASTQGPNFYSRVPIVITEIWTYHWNNGRGATPGTVSIKCSDGKTYGPWQCAGSSGSGGAPNVNWTTYPHAKLPAGAYTLIDSSPDTWSENAGSHSVGFVKVTGHP